CRSYRVRTTTDSSPTSSARRNDPPASLLSEDSTYSTHFERGPMSKTLDRIAELGLDLPQIAAPAGAYVPALRTGNYVYTSGQMPGVGGKLPATGLLGTDVDVDTRHQLARTARLHALAAIAGVIGALARIVRVVKVPGFVNPAHDFTQP